MPVADYKTYCRMLDGARENHFAYPAINVSSLTTANAVLKGLAESRSDGIIQVSTGGGAFASGSAIKDMALGAISIAEHVHRVGERYDIYVALHTDHCQADVLDSYVIPLIEETEKRRAAGKPNLFNSHMFDGSALSLTENQTWTLPFPFSSAVTKTRSFWRWSVGLWAAKRKGLAVKVLPLKSSIPLPKTCSRSPGASMQ